MAKESDNLNGGVTKWVLALAGAIITALILTTWTLGLAWADGIDKQVRINTMRLTRLETQYEQNALDHTRILQVLDRIEKKER